MSQPQLVSPTLGCLAAIVTLCVAAVSSKPKGGLFDDDDDDDGGDIFSFAEKPEPSEEAAPVGKGGRVERVVLYACMSVGVSGYGVACHGAHILSSLSPMTTVDH
jgi:hypothetical protein